MTGIADQPLIQDVRRYLAVAHKRRALLLTARRPQPAGGGALQLHDAAGLPGHRADPHRQGPAQGAAGQPDGRSRPAGHADRVRAAARARARRAPGRAAGAPEEPRAADGPDDGSLGALPAPVPGPRPRGGRGPRRHAALAGRGGGALAHLRRAAARRAPRQPALPRLRPGRRRARRQRPGRAVHRAAQGAALRHLERGHGLALRAGARAEGEARGRGARADRRTRRSNGIAAARVRPSDEHAPSPPPPSPRAWSAWRRNRPSPRCAASAPASSRRSRRSRPAGRCRRPAPASPSCSRSRPGWRRPWATAIRTWCACATRCGRPRTSSTPRCAPPCAPSRARCRAPARAKRPWPGTSSGRRATRSPSTATAWS